MWGLRLVSGVSGQMSLGYDRRNSSHARSMFERPLTRPTFDYECRCSIDSRGRFEISMTPPSHAGALRMDHSGLGAVGLSSGVTRTLWVGLWGA